MCLGAIYWARPDRIYYAANREDAAAIGFDDSLIYKEMNLSPEKRIISGEEHDREEALATLADWKASENKIEY